MAPMVYEGQWVGLRVSIVWEGWARDPLSSHKPDAYWWNRWQRDRSCGRTRCSCDEHEAPTVRRLCKTKAGVRARKGRRFVPIDELAHQRNSSRLALGRVVFH